MLPVCIPLPALRHLATLSQRTVPLICSSYGTNSNPPICGHYVCLSETCTDLLAVPTIGTACKMSVASCSCTACYICWGMTMSWEKNSYTQWHSRSRTSCKTLPGRFAMLSSRSTCQALYMCTTCSTSSEYIT